MSIGTSSLSRSQGEPSRKVAGSVSAKKTARIAGVFYMLVGIFGGFSEGFVDPKMYVAGNAVETVKNVVANSELMRVGVAAHLLDAIFFVTVALVLHALFQHVHKAVARTMLVFVALAVGIISLNAVFQFEALRVATGAVDMASLGHAGSNAIVLLLVDIQHYGTLAAQVFFGLWLIPLGYLAYKSGWFSKVLSILLAVAGACYLVDLFVVFLGLNLGSSFHSLIVIPCAIAEIWMVGYLLFVGVRKHGATDLAAG